MAMSSVTDVRKEDYQKEDELSVSRQLILFQTSSHVLDYLVIENAFYVINLCVNRNFLKKNNNGRDG